MTLAEFTDRYGTEAACHAALAAARWPQGFRCPRCGGSEGWTRHVRPLTECRGCGYECSPTAGTIFHRTHVPLSKWFLAMYLDAESKRGISALELSTKIGVSYSTAWYMQHRLRSAMGQRDGTHLLDGLVDADDAYFGGAGHGLVGRGTKRPSAVVAVSVTAKGAPRHLKIALVADYTQPTVNDVMRRMAAPGAVIRTDGLSAFADLQRVGFLHQAVPTKHLPAGTEPFPVLHTQISNAKAWIGGTFHGLGATHLQSYLDAFCFRFNRRRLPSVFRRLVVACATANPHPLRRGRKRAARRLRLVPVSG